MVTGMETFKHHFIGFEDSFLLIGGAACDAWFTSCGGRFRATKDIDMVPECWRNTIKCAI